MIAIDRNPQFDALFEQIKGILSSDDTPEPTLKEINAVISDLHHHYQLRSNIVDMEPMISELHKPFYEAFNDLLIRFGVSDVEVINFIISDLRGTFVLITQ